MNQKKYPDAFLYFIAFVAWLLMVCWAMRSDQQRCNDFYDDSNIPPPDDYELMGEPRV